MAKLLYFLLHDYRSDFPEEENPENFISYFGEDGLRDILAEANGRRIVWEFPENDPENPALDLAPSYSFEE